MWQGNHVCLHQGHYTVHVMLKHELCSLLFFMVCGLALVFVSGLLGLGVCHTLTTRVSSVGLKVSIHDWAVVDWSRVHTWFVLMCWCEICQWILYCIIFEAKGSQRTVLSWVGTAMDWVKRTNPSNPCCWLRVWKTRASFSAIEITIRDSSTYAVRRRFDWGLCL